MILNFVLNTDGTIRSVWSHYEDGGSDAEARGVAVDCNGDMWAVKNGLSNVGPNSAIDFTSLPLLIILQRSKKSMLPSTHNILKKHS